MTPTLQKPWRKHKPCRTIRYYAYYRASIMKCCRSYFLKWIRKSFLFTRKAFIFYIPTANRVPGMHIYFRVHNLWWGKRHHFTSKVKNLSPSAEGFCSFTTLLTPEYPYFVSVLNFYSYLFIFPYKIVYCSNLKSFKLQTSTPRKVILWKHNDSFAQGFSFNTHFFCFNRRCAF